MVNAEPKVNKSEVVSFRISKSEKQLLKRFMEEKKIEKQQKFCEDYLWKKFLETECDYEWKIR